VRGFSAPGAIRHWSGEYDLIGTTPGFRCPRCITPPRHAAKTMKRVPGTTLVSVIQMIVSIKATILRSWTAE
jgi:hypothetical protein